MRKLKEVLRLHSLGLSQHQIARSCFISQSTVHEYVSAAQAADVTWPLPENWDDSQIEQALFPQRPAPAVWRKHTEPDWAKVHQELQTHKDLTLQLVWQEGRESHPEGYGYSRFCDLYRRWLKKLDLVLRQEHRAGEKMFGSCCVAASNSMRCFRPRSARTPVTVPTRKKTMISAYWFMA